MNRYFILTLFLMLSCCSLAQQSKCNKTLRYSHLKSKLDSSICVPLGYHIINIYEADLNGDAGVDKIVRYQKVNLSDGDSILYAIYKNTRGQFIFLKIFSNLRPLYFKNYDVKSGNKFYDSLKRLYFYPNHTSVEFFTSTIEISLYTDPATIKKLSFTYSAEEDTWILSREIQWFVPPKNYEGDEKLDENGRKLEYDRAPETPLRIEDFDMLKYIGW